MAIRNTNLGGATNWADDEILYAADLNDTVDAGVATRTIVEAGEDISTSDVCYINLSDGKAYISDKDTQADYRADGIAYAGVSSGADVVLITRGLYITTGLIDKEVYYLGTTGAISTTISSVRVGVANGTTDLYVNVIQDDRDAVGTIKGVNLNLTGAPVAAQALIEPPPLAVPSILVPTTPEIPQLS